MKPTNFSKFRTALISNIIRADKIEEIADISDLEITNAKSHYRLKYGQRFNDMLEARDQVLEHQFVFKFAVDPMTAVKDSDFIGGELYLSLIENIKEFLAESVGNVVSIAFNFLCKGDLLEKEAMEFASKNIILNVHSIFKHTVHSIKEHPILKDLVKIEELKENLIFQIDIILKNILINLADSYPQAAASGGTIRMRQAIAEVNRVDDEETDLIYANNIKIDKHLKLGTNEKGWEKIIFDDEGDYTEYIMEVLNAAVQIPQSSDGDSRERSTKQIFTEFNEIMFWTCQQKKYQEIIHSLEDKKSELGKTKIKGEGEKIKNNLCSYYQQILQSNQENLEKIRLSHKMTLPKLGSKDHEADNSFFYEEKKEMSGETVLETLVELAVMSDEGIQSIKKDKKYLIGQKIPPSVKPFGREEMVLKQFRAKHSSIFRILTKWAGYLEEIFQNANKYVKQRAYSFKTLHNELVIVNSIGINQLIKQLQEQYVNVKKKFGVLLKSSYELLGQQLGAEQKSFVSFVTRFTETRTVSSKINAILTSLMLKYTNILIHHLLKAGQFIDCTRYKGQNLNLIVFRVSDILRAKFQCSQSTFINLLKTMYILDNNEQLRKEFKLIRIKNKLDDPANNIMINYLLKGKVQCQLQLSVSEPHGKEKNYYSFSHFVYELTRGKFGVIADCAIMISQLDPMISSCKGNYYEEKSESMIKVMQQLQHTETPQEGKNDNKIQPAKQDVNKQIQTQKISKQLKESIFQCLECSKLIINEINYIFSKQSDSTVCNECLIARKDPQRLLREPYKALIEKGIQNNWLQKINKYSEFQNSNGKYYVSLNGSGKPILNLVIKIDWEYKIFAFQINNKLLQRIDFSSLHEDQIDYVDITKKISSSKPKKNSELLYSVTSLENISEEFMKLIHTDKQLLKVKEKIAIQWFRDFRLEKSLIKTIKFKAEVIETNNNEKKFKTMERIVTQLMLKEDTTQESSLKYRKIEHLEGSNIKTLLANKVEISKFPEWIQNFDNLKILRLSVNKITEVKKEDLPSSLLELCISSNELQQIDLSCLKDLNILELKFNKLQSIDLSHNIKLTELLLQSNKFASIDVSNNTQLVNFQINTNPLTSIDVSKNCSLQLLYVYETQITNLDLSQNPKLEKLQLDNNKLTEINLSQQKQLKQLYIDHNQLKKIDFSQNPDLQEAYVNHNQIESIDLSKNTKITHFWANSNKLSSIDISYNVQLKQFRGQFNQLTSIDVSHNTKLEDLKLNTNQLTQIDVSQNPKLKIFYVYSNKLTSLDLSCNKEITDLQINANQISQIQSIPASVVTLYVDQKSVTNFDFTQLPKLKNKNLK